jgi:hypothetical protein
MYASDTSDQLWSDQNGPKKRGPKPKNEPAATVPSFHKKVFLIR